MINQPKSLQIPFQDSMNDRSGLLANPWEMFFRTLKEIIDPLGFPRFTQLQNLKTNEPVEGIKFDSAKESCVFLDYVVQRATSTPAAAADGGTAVFVFKPIVNQWIQSNPAAAGSTGVSFSVGTDGQLKYTSSDWAGVHLVFRLTLRMRTLAGGKKG